jgi:predicted acetyltransferase
MTDSTLVTTDPAVRRAADSDRPVLERLWLLFRHDLSELTGTLPGPDGCFRTERLESAFTDPDWAPYLITSGRHPVGLAVVRGLSGPARVLNSFFVVRGARRAGLGLRAARHVIGLYPGPWEVAFQDANLPAVRFWRRVATEIAGADWSEQRRPVPARPDLPPDVWIRIESRS